MPSTDNLLEEARAVASRTAVNTKERDGVGGLMPQWRRERDKRTTLVVRFGVLSAVLIAMLGIVLAGFLRSTVEQRALAQAERMAANVALIGVRPHLRPADFLGGQIDPQRMAALEHALAGEDGARDLTRVKIFDLDGAIIYSDEHRLIGRGFGISDELATALSGGTVSELRVPEGGETIYEHNLRTVLEVYVPMQLPEPDGDGEVIGAFQIYLPYDPVAAAAAEDVRRLLLALSGGLAALWLGLFRLVAIASARLRRQEHRMRWLAHHDTLTELPNRALFTERAAQRIAASRGSNTGVAVLLCDLDRFKEVNDTLGHHIGDALLRQVGLRLNERLPEADTVARLGGDEFAVLLTDVADTPAAVKLAERLVEALRAPYTVEGLTLEVDGSVGLARFPDHGDDIGRLMQCADVAMYASKTAHDGVAVYDLAMDAHTPARLALFGELRRAIDQGHLVLHYQPKVAVATGCVTGVEALVRWQHPERGLLHPPEFLDVAEQTGLMRPLTVSVLNMALTDCKQWREAGRDLTVAVNLSARSLMDTQLPGDVAMLLRVHGLRAEALELEITETTAMVDPGRALRVLGQLHTLGVGLSVDDYGTGHASLSYLHRLPIQELKIDRSFVQHMDRSPNDDVIVRSTIDLARNLGLLVVAEGVETEATWRRLTELSCDAAQGFWLARPCPIDELADAVAALEGRVRQATPAAAVGE